MIQTQFPRLLSYLIPLLVVLGRNAADLPAAINTLQPPDKTAAEEVPDQERPKERRQAPPEPLTDADRIARLQTTIASDEEALDEQRAQLDKQRAEEEATGEKYQKVAARFEALSEQLQKAEKDGDLSAVKQLQEQLEPLTNEHQLAKEQFDLAVQARKTSQEQVATLQAKIDQDQQALAKLQGLEVASPEKEAPAEPPPQPPASPTTALPGPMGLVTGQPAAQDTAKPAETKKAAESKAVKQARKAVEEKETALADLEDDLEALAESELLLEKNIELESTTLETARKQYDNLEKELAAAEAGFDERLNAGAPATELTELRRRIGEIQQQMRDSRQDIRDSTDRLRHLQKELSTSQNEEAALVAQRRKLERQAEAAKRSALFVKARQYAVDTLPKLLAILVAMFIFWMIITLIAGRARRWIDREATGTKAERKHRSETLIGVLQNTANAIIVIGGVLMMLDAARIPIAVLLGGAGVAGLAIAFAAQNLIKDYFCGFLLLLENQFRLGDVISINGMKGAVERMTLRITVLRNLEGHVFYIPNGQITAVKNSTTGWARVLVDIGVAYKEDINHAIDVLLQIAAELRADPEYARSIVGDPEMFGVDALADSSVIVKLGLKVRPQAQWSVRRELLRRVKHRFDELGIEIPFPQRTIHHRTDNGAPPIALGHSDAAENN